MHGNIIRVPHEIKPIIRRTEMPQISQDMYGELLVYLSQHKIRVSAGLMNPNHLYYHQDVNFDRCKVISADNMKQPVLISCDLAVFDGNHRSYAHVVKEMLVPYIQLDVSFKRGLPILNAFPKCQHAIAA